MNAQARAVGRMRMPRVRMQMQRVLGSTAPWRSSPSPTTSMASYNGQNPYAELFDLSYIPYYASSPVITALDRTLTTHPSHTLIFHLLLSLAQLPHPQSLYPPTAALAFNQLLNLIAECAFDTLKRDCLVYYLLKDWDAVKPGPGEDVALGLAPTWAIKRRIPVSYRTSTEAYWMLDHGQHAAAIPRLTDPRVTPDFTTHILNALTPSQLSASPTSETESISAQLILRFVRHSHPPLATFPELEIYLVALCEANFGEAWMYVQSFKVQAEADGEDGQRVVWGSGSVDEAGSIYTRLTKRLIEWALAPKPRQQPLITLLSLPLPAHTLTLLNSLALHPPSPFPVTSIPILHTLLHTRALQLGQYSQAASLDSHFTAVMSQRGIADRMSETANRVAGEAARARKDALKRVTEILPKVQRKLLSVELGPAAHGDIDMDAGRSRAGPSQDQQPLSSSLAQTRTAAGPRDAVLKAFARSTAAQTSPTKSKPKQQHAPMPSIPKVGTPSVQNYAASLLSRSHGAPSPQRLPTQQQPVQTPTPPIDINRRLKPTSARDTSRLGPDPNAAHFVVADSAKRKRDERKKQEETAKFVEQFQREFGMHPGSTDDEGEDVEEEQTAEEDTDVDYDAAPRKRPSPDGKGRTVQHTTQEPSITPIQEEDDIDMDGAHLETHEEEQADEEAERPAPRRRTPSRAAKKKSTTPATTPTRKKRTSSKNQAATEDVPPVPAIPEGLRASTTIPGEFPTDPSWQRSESMASLATTASSASINSVSTAKGNKRGNDDDGTTPRATRRRTTGGKSVPVPEESIGRRTRSSLHLEETDEGSGSGRQVRRSTRLSVPLESGPPLTNGSAKKTPGTGRRSRATGAQQAATTTPTPAGRKNKGYKPASFAEEDED